MPIEELLAAYQAMKDDADGSDDYEDEEDRAPPDQLDFLPGDF